MDFTHFVWHQDNIVTLYQLSARSFIYGVLPVPMFLFKKILLILLMLLLPSMAREIMGKCQHSLGWFPISKDLWGFAWVKIPVFGG